MQKGWPHKRGSTVIAIGLQKQFYLETGMIMRSNMGLRIFLHFLVNFFPLFLYKTSEKNIWFQTIIVPTVPKLMFRAAVDCVGKPRILIQCSCLIAPLRDHESALWRTRMVLPNTGRKIADWLLCGFIQCANLHVRTLWSIAASVH